MLPESDRGESLTPQPSIADLETLSAALRAAGLPVELTIEGRHDDLPPALQLLEIAPRPEGGFAVHAALRLAGAT